MWRFDQGRIEYFQFDEIRKIAKFAVANDLRAALRSPLVEATKLPFLPNKPGYRPWRNHSRIFKTLMLVANIGGVAQPTKICRLLATDGQVTSDEYFHFWAQTFTDPAPSFKGWAASSAPRFPLLFTLKFLLARAVLGAPAVKFGEIIGAYEGSDFTGEENQEEFIRIAKIDWKPVGRRQARESIQVLSQISYLSATSSDVAVSLDLADAIDVFNSLEAVRGTQAANSDLEVMRLGDLFEGAVAGLELDYSKTVLDQTVEAGFAEGTRVERTHVVLERNQAVRQAFFAARPEATCDFCARDTRVEYPWTERVLDVHHVLPLCSGTRSTKEGTVMSDLVAICPTCHRAVHRYSARWLKRSGRKDFEDATEARAVYDGAKVERKGI
jgi:hypothetical protein